MKNTKQLILDNSLQLFSRKGFDAVSTSDIAELTGITKGALYKHFQNKEDILQTLISSFHTIFSENNKTFIQNNPKPQDIPGLKQYINKYLQNLYSFWKNGTNTESYLNLLTVIRNTSMQNTNNYENFMITLPVNHIEEILNIFKKNKSNLSNTERSIAETLYSYVFFSLNNPAFQNQEEVKKNITLNTAVLIQVNYKAEQPKSLLQRAANIHEK